jgi:hypothetical protein
VTDEEFIRAWQAITANVPKTLTDLRPWRSMREAMTPLLAELDMQIRSADEAELEALRQRAAEIEARLNASHSAAVEARRSAPPKPARAPSPLDETDAGNGVRETETNVSAQQFRSELQTLRAQNVARRRRRGLEH